jgi:Ca2+-binding RTX toxin-like protein
MDIIGTGGNDILRGTDGDDNIVGLQGNDTVIASKGNDILDGFFPPIPKGPAIGSEERNIVDYTNIGRPVKLLISEFFTLKVNKSDFGSDSIIDFTQIIGSANKQNQIDGRSISSDRGLNINLGNNYALGGTVGLIGTGVGIEIKNFVDAIGTKNNDTIVGANKNGKLTGGGGSDTITGGNRNDILTGSDSTARGVGEVDVLTGGGGRDKFVLGDANGAYYVGKGKDDFATITDFNIFQDSISLGGFKNYSFGFSGNNSVELYSGKDVNTRDLIAKIQISGGFSNRTTNSRSMMGTNSNIDAIVGNIDILSGANVNA